MADFFVSEHDLKIAVDRLGSCPEGAKLIGYLIVKRASVIGSSGNVITTGIQNVPWVQAHMDWAAVAPFTYSANSDGIPRIDYFVPFRWKRESQRGLRQYKYPSNGVSDNLPKWQTQSANPPVKWLPGTERPKQYQIADIAPEKLRVFVYGDAQQSQAGVVDTALWWCRSLGFDGPTTTEKLLVDRMLTENALTDETARALFDFKEYVPGRTVDLERRQATFSNVLPELPTEVRTDPQQGLESLGWSSSQVSKCLSILSGPQPQLILSGPPGTGKTYAAKILASHLTGGSADRLEIVGFHPSYGYEDFVFGIGPKPDALSGMLQFSLIPGVVPRLIKQCEGSTDPFVLIIDEINRANLHRVFGELMYGIEYRGERISSLYGQSLTIPENLVLIGTMNSADRSIRHLDAAMRRRFRIFELLPNVDVIRNHYGSGSENQLGELLFDGFNRLNTQIAADLDRHHQIGHSYFIHHQMTAEVLRDVFSQQIAPLLEDYFMDDPSRLGEYQFERFWPGAEGG